MDNALVLNGTELNGREIKVSAHNCARCPCRHVMCSLAVAPSRLFKSVCPRLLVAVVVAVVVAVAVVGVVADVAATAVVDVAVAGVAGITAPATRRTEAQTSDGRVERRMLACRTGVSNTAWILCVTGVKRARPCLLLCLLLCSCVRALVSSWLMCEVRVCSKVMTNTNNPKAASLLFQAYEAASLVASPFQYAMCTPSRMLSLSALYSSRVWCNSWSRYRRLSFARAR